MTAHEVVIRFGRPFDVHLSNGFFVTDVREIAVTIPFADRESAEAALREIETFVRAVHDAGGEDYRPVVAGEVLPQAALTRPDALRESAREAHAKGRITSADLADRLSRIAFTEEQDKRDG